MSPEFIIMLKDAADMFTVLAVELTILFLSISYLVGVLQEYITPAKIQSILSSRNGKGYVIAALLGSITPFCSCSTIPFLKGLLRARAGFGPMMVFLFASPLLNPVVIGLFVVTFGLDVAVFYFSVAMTVSIASGYTLEYFGFDKYVREEAFETPNASNCNKDKGCDSDATPEKKDNRWLRVWHSTWKDFKQVLPYLVLSITLGSVIYGFVPTELIAEYAGADKWYAIPIAAVIGIPLYIRASAVIPMSAALVQKGMAMGSVMALIIGSAGASLTEVILLKSLFKNQMIAAFLVVVLGMAVSAGFLYGYLFG
ncbi:permease [Enterovibrio coralii]|uniref:Permease n=1 Tax=Enterovibrio coralii TaxID=294935 RepID=A0A135I9M5_9GAMM|nr:permease [Enterovibrio coralii]KXF82137.1 hypothetical protein ATN88_17220 [Enterovibrio coralii]